MPLPFSCGAGEQRGQQHKGRSLPAPHPARPRRAACIHAVAPPWFSTRSPVTTMPVVRPTTPDHTCPRRRRQGAGARRAGHNHDTMQRQWSRNITDKRIH